MYRPDRFTSCCLAVVALAVVITLVMLAVLALIRSQARECRDRGGEYQVQEGTCTYG